MPYLLTFNKPAALMFFDGDSPKGLKVEITKEGCRFKPTKQEFGPGIIPVQERVRGGYTSTLIEGEYSTTLLNALSNPRGYPFFTLSRGSGGWIIATPWDGPDKIEDAAPGKKRKAPEPRRFEPHIRVWLRDKPKTEDAPAVEFQAPNLDVEDAVEAESTRDLLMRLRETVEGVETAPYGKAMTTVNAVSDLIERLRAPLEKAAHAEAQALLGERTKRRAPSRDAKHAARNATEVDRIDASPPKANRPQAAQTLPGLSARRMRGFREKTAHIN